MFSTNWSNMNCQAMNYDGSFFAVGTFNGQIFLLKLVSKEQCSQISYNRHDKCVMVMSWCGRRKLVSVSYDEILVIMEMSEGVSPEKELSFTKFCLGAIPKQIKFDSGIFFMTMQKGMMIYSE